MPAPAARFDWTRTTLAAVAAGVAVIAAALDATDLSMSFQEIALPYLGLAALAALGLAAIPGAQRWSDSRRRAAVLLAIAWAVIGLLVSPFAIAATGCACGGAGPAYVPPEVLGIETRYWILIAIVSGPVLLLLTASSLPDRMRLRH